MPLFSSFNPFGMLTFSSQPSYAHRIYNTMRASQGGEDGAFREFGYQGGKLYATAMMLGRVQEGYKRVTEQHSPKTTTFMLPEKELEYGITPDSSLTAAQRRDRLEIKYIGGIGTSETDLINGLTTVLGDGFVELIPPSDPFFADLVDNFSPDPDLTKSKFQDPTIPGKWLLALRNYGTNEISSLLAKLICGTKPEVGEKFVFGEENAGNVQVVTISGIQELGDEDNTVQLTFEEVFKPISKFQGFTSNSYPFYPTGRRRFMITVTEEAAKDARLMANVDSYMNITTRAPTTWDKQIDQTPGFILGTSLMGFSIIG